MGMSKILTQKTCSTAAAPTRRKTETLFFDQLSLQTFCNEVHIFSHVNYKLAKKISRAIDLPTLSFK